MPDATAGGSWVDRYMPSSRPEYYGENLIDLAMVRGFLWRQRFILAGVIGVALLLGFVATLLIKPTYQATATVRVDPMGAQIVEGQDLADAAVHPSEISRQLETLGAVVKSRAMAYLVVDSLGLASNDEFLGIEAASQPPEGMTAKQWQMQRREMATSVVQGNVAVDVPLDSRIISITYGSPNQAMVAKVANAFADNFLTDDVRRGLETNSYAQKYLEDQITKTRSSLQDAV